MSQKHVQVLDQEIRDIDRQVVELGREVVLTKTQERKIALLEARQVLMERKDGLKDELISMKDSRRGMIYALRLVKDRKPVYVGLTQQNPQGVLESNEVRYRQHAQKIVDIFKNGDLFHIYAAGKVASYMVKTGTTQVSTGLVRNVICTEPVKVGVFKTGDLERLETLTIQEFQRQGHTLYNSNKRCDVVRSKKSSDLVGTKRTRPEE